jgi:type 2 lantibiotic biosynthesis protein LanM
MNISNKLKDQLLREGWSLLQRLDAAPPDFLASTILLESWCQVVAPDRPSNFDKRLRWDGLSADRAAWALDPPEDATPQNPDWWPLLEAMRKAARDSADDSLYRQLADRGNKLAFVHVWRPVAAWALETLRFRCADLQHQLQLSDAAWLDLGEALLNRLCSTADQVLRELFNQRRTPGQMLLAHLGVNGDGSGEPVREAYNAFVVELLSTGYELLLTNYPVLGRLLATITQLWLEGMPEMLQRVAQSRLQLQQVFSISLEAVLQKVQLGLSDPHRGGRAVAILTFGGIDDFIKVVYKPKDMRVDVTYQQYLKIINNASALEPLRCLNIFNGDGYGFMEWVEHCQCSTDEMLARFYMNAGRIMAVLYLLGCTDCHYENLIASGDQLILIDTETLLDADLRDLISVQGDAPNEISALQASIQGSVLRSGLLPQWLITGAGKKQAFDVSALGIQPPPLEKESVGWLGLNSDGMMAGRRLQPCELPTSLPVGLGSPQRLTDFIEELCTGFATQLQESIRLRPLLSQALGDFSNQPRRLVARNTRVYFNIQQQMLEPASLRNAVAHGLKLEQLSRVFLVASEKPLNWPMLRAELLQMERLDIPFFEHLIDGEDLPLPEGLASIPKFIKISGLCAARLRLNQLNQAEIEFQQRLIRGAIAAIQIKISISAEPKSNAAIASESPLVDLNDYRQEAFQLGQQLWDSAIRDSKSRPEWLGMDLGVDGESFHFGLIGICLYSGSSGIALLFARLALASEGSTSELWKRRAWSCYENLDELSERNNNDQLYRLVRDLPFGLSGSGGILLGLQLLKRAGLPDADALAERLISQLRPERLLADESVDVIGGVSGLIGPLLMVGTQRSLELANVCGDRLLSLQLDSGGWSAGVGKHPLTGFSHGAAGMGAALAQLAQVSKEDRFAAGARQAVAYERAVFDAEHGNWPDFRNSGDSADFMLSWCHGAPGILLARSVVIAADLADEHTAAELHSARITTLATLKQLPSFPGDTPAHLCCGALGLTSLLRVDAKINKLELTRELPITESALLRNAHAIGSYTFFNVDTGSLNLPGLFTGKAGVALALIEAVDGLYWLPSVLSAGLLDVPSKAC